MGVTKVRKDMASGAGGCRLQLQSLKLKWLYQKLVFGKCIIWDLFKDHLKYSELGLGFQKLGKDRLLVGYIFDWQSLKDKRESRPFLRSQPALCETIMKRKVSELVVAMVSFPWMKGCIQGWYGWRTISIFSIRNVNLSFLKSRESGLYMMSIYSNIIAQLCSILCNPMAPLWDFSGKNPGVGCRFLLQRIFPTLKIRATMRIRDYLNKAYDPEPWKVNNNSQQSPCLH